MSTTHYPVPSAHYPLPSNVPITRVRVCFPALSSHFLQQPGPVVGSFILLFPPIPPPLASGPLDRDPRFSNSELETNSAPRSPQIRLWLTSSAGGPVAPNNTDRRLDRSGGLPKRAGTHRHGHRPNQAFRLLQGSSTGLFLGPPLTLPCPPRDHIPLQRFPVVGTSVGFRPFFKRNLPQASFAPPCCCWPTSITFFLPIS